MAAKLTRLTHKIALQLYLVPETCTVYSSHSRLRGRKLLDHPCTHVAQPGRIQKGQRPAFDMGRRL